MTRPPSHVGKALREAGFVPLPRLWVRPEELALIRRIAFQNADEVNRIREEVCEQLREEGWG